MGRAVYFSHPASLRHETGRHPERPARIVAIEQELDGRGWLGFERVESPAVARELVELVHTAAHFDRIERVAAAGGGAFDMDTLVSPGSFEAALRAAGGAVALVEELLDGTATTGFSAHRPPGHHATRERAMGFCLFNNVAIAARAALRRDGVDRVLILDWDVHHGNGTNDQFRETDEVLYVSIHESPLYPGSGPASDRGVGAGSGFTVNLPVGEGSGDGVFCSLVDHVVCDLARDYEPDVVLISAGYDAHRDDPLADCTVSEGGYAAMTATMRRVCEELGVPLGVVLEGGYGLDALAGSVAATMEVLVADVTPAAGGLPVHPVARAARERLGLGVWPD